MKMFDTPILFLIFNRPELTRRVFEKIREIKPKYLFVAADGPREIPYTDLENCKESRKIIDQIDWDCEVQTLFREKNLGCKYAVSSAINWFFESVEAGIILEDDVLADESFFYFSQQMLDRYENDQRIMMISGLNVCGEWKSKCQDYHFSYYGGIWGWASWRRSWNNYDVDIKKWEIPEVRNQLLNFFPSFVRDARQQMYDKLFRAEINTWDLQWTFAKLLNSGLTIIPSRNLIKNIGCSDGGTHLTSSHPWADLPVSTINLPCSLNEVVLADTKYDAIHLGIEKQSKKSSIGKFAKNLIKWRSLSA